MPTELETPALDKLQAARNDLGTEHIGVFLEWLLHEKKGQLCTFQHTPGVPCPHSGKRRRELIRTGVMAVGDTTCPGCGADLPDFWMDLHEWKEDPLPEGYYPLSMSIEALLAEYAGIDMVAVERERRVLLDAVRQQQS